MGRPVVFFHIPKTAGSSFLHVLGRVYSEENSFSVTGTDPLRALEELKAIPPERKDRIELLKGHLLLEADWILDRECRFMAFFRAPIERTVSSFHYLQKAGHNAFHEEVRRLSLRDFPDFLLRQRWNDLQTRFLSTDPERIRFFQERKDSSALHEKGVGSARSVLHQKIDHPLITEEFDRALVYLAGELAWSHIPVPEVKNASRSKRKKRIGQKTLSELEKVNELDLELYEEAKGIFYRNLEAVWSEDMERSLHDLQERKKAVPSPKPGFFERLKKKLWS